jgi:hypothetical protein
MAEGVSKSGSPPGIYDDPVNTNCVHFRPGIAWGKFRRTEQCPRRVLVGICVDTEILSYGMYVVREATEKS